MTQPKVLRIQYKDLKKKNTNIGKITRNFNKNGVIVVEGILNKDQCNHYIDLLEKAYLKYSQLYVRGEKKITHSAYYAAKTVSNLHNKNISFLRFIDHPIALSLVNAFLKQGSFMNSEKIICQAIEARSTIGKSHSQSQQLHNDARIVGSYFPLIVQVMWALDSFTKYNGATRFVIGSHRFMKFPKNGKVYSGEKVIEVPSGSAIIFNGALWHGSSKTKEEQTRRWGIICRYARWFLKPSYDFQKNTPKKIFNKMNKNQKDLLGFRFNPPQDEFDGNRAIRKKYSKQFDYTLPV